MPYKWIENTKGAPDNSGAPLLFADGALPMAELTIWPYRSLSRRGFVIFMAITAVMAVLPLLPFLGTKAWWGLLPFMAGTIALIWFFLSHSYRDAEILETLCLWPDHISLSQLKPGKEPLVWEANPYWVHVTLHATGGRVPDYLTLKGKGREVELGAFLSPSERRMLQADLRDQLARLNEMTKS